MKKTEIICLLLAFIIVFSILGGCAGDKNVSADSTPDSKAPTPTPSDEVVEKGIDWSRYPIVTDDSVTLSAWWPTSNIYVTDPNETLPFIEGAKRTGIKWEFQVPSSGSESEQFNLLIASMEYPDLIKNFGNYYTKGFDTAIDEELIIAIDDYSYAMPSIMEWRNESDLIYKSLTTDSGHFAGIPLILIGSKDHKAQGAFSGYGIRTDWLDNLGLSVPETYSELETVMKAFQDAGYCQNPLEIWPSADTYAIMGGYNIVSVMPVWGQLGGWMMEGDTVKYALFEDNFRSYITMLNDWYEKEFFESDYYTVTTGWDNALTKVSNNEMGIFNFMYTWYELFKSTAIDPTLDIAALPVLRHSKADAVHVRSASSGASIAACITTQCANPEYVCAYWNYFFTEEGILLGNYGVEGETFDYNENQEPIWNEGYYSLVEEHDASYAQSMLFNFLGPGFRWWDRELQSVGETEKSFLAVWDSNEFTDSDYFYPASATMTGEESLTYSNIMIDIGTYLSETLTAFIIGQKSMDEWDSFLEQVKSMDIEGARICKQAAYDRYNQR